MYISTYGAAAKIAADRTSSVAFIYIVLRVAACTYDFQLIHIKVISARYLVIHNCHRSPAAYTFDSSYHQRRCTTEFEMAHI